MPQPSFVNPVAGGHPSSKYCTDPFKLGGHVVSSGTGWNGDGHTYAGCVNGKDIYVAVHISSWTASLRTPNWNGTCESDLPAGTYGKTFRTASKEEAQVALVGLTLLFHAEPTYYTNGSDNINYRASDGSYVAMEGGKWYLNSARSGGDYLMCVSN